MKKRNDRLRRVNIVGEHGDFFLRKVLTEIVCWIIRPQVVAARSVK